MSACVCVGFFGRGTHFYLRNSVMNDKKIKLPIFFFYMNSVLLSQLALKKGMYLRRISSRSRVRISAQGGQENSRDSDYQAVLKHSKILQFLPSFLGVHRAITVSSTWANGSLPVNISQRLDSSSPSDTPAPTDKDNKEERAFPMCLRNRFSQPHRPFYTETLYVFFSYIHRTLISNENTYYPFYFPTFRKMRYGRHFVQ